jgi:hypothetical protein
MIQPFAKSARKALRLGMALAIVMSLSHAVLIQAHARQVPVLGDLAREERSRREAEADARALIPPNVPTTETDVGADSAPEVPPEPELSGTSVTEDALQQESPTVAELPEPEQNEANPTLSGTSSPAFEPDVRLPAAEDSGGEPLSVEADNLEADDVEVDDVEADVADGGNQTPGVPPAPLPLLVSAGVDQTVVLPDSRSLPVAVSLTGLVSTPRGGSVSVEWSQVSGPEPVGFLSGHSLETTVALVAPGDYELRLTVTTGQQTRSADVRITLILIRPDVNVGGLTPTVEPPARDARFDARFPDPGADVGRFLPVGLVDVDSRPTSSVSAPTVLSEDAGNQAADGADVLDLPSSYETDFPTATFDETFASAAPVSSDSYTGVNAVADGTDQDSEAESNVYVSKDGDDRSNGTERYPYRTIRKALSSIGPGDTLFIREGTYDQGVHTLSDLVPSGTSFDAPVTIRGYPGEVVVLQPGTGFSVLYLAGSVRYTVWQDLVVDGSNLTYPDARGIELLNGASSNRFANIEVRNVGGTGIYVAGGEINAANQFIDMIVHDVALGLDGDGHGIHVASPDNTIDGGEFYDISGESGNSWAIQIGDGDVGADRNVVRNARVHDTQFGIALGGGDDNVAYNNVIYDSLGVGVRLDFGPESDGNRFVNNTVVGNPGPAVQVGAEGVLSNTQIVNNIFWRNGVDAVADAGIGTVIESNVFVDPLFLNEDENDFRLTRDSPAIDAGSTLGEVAADVDGVLRPQGEAFDAGAYEYPNL